MAARLNVWEENYQPARPGPFSLNTTVIVLGNQHLNEVNEDGRENLATRPAGLVLSNPGAPLLNVRAVY